MPKFFVMPEKVQNDKILIDNEDVDHIKRVLRLKKDDIITVCDTCGYDYEAKIFSIEDKAVICDILNKQKSDSEPDIKVTLYQGLPKASKMDYIIQKTTELGITTIVPCIMSRCVVKLDGQKAEEKKVQRWQKVAKEAGKQSGRGIIPDVLMPMTLKQAVERMKNDDLVFVPYECEEISTIKSVLNSYDAPKTISFIIGPEGGFDPSEIQMLIDAGFKTVTLGKRILRTETAGEAVLSMVMYHYSE